MKEILVGALTVAVVTIVLGPWALLLTEGTSLFLTGHVLTSIPWDVYRVAIAALWPIACLGVVTVFTRGELND